jgi:serine protease Do
MRKFSLLILLIFICEISVSFGDEILISRRNAITVASASASKAVVGITVTEVKRVYYNSPSYFNNDIFSRFFRRYQKRRRVKEYEVKGLGSGFIISNDGYILTNHHVAGRASKVVVTMVGGKKYDARIIGSDMTSDIALLKIDAKNLPYLKFSSEDAIIGQWAIALGNPFGLFDNNAKPTVTVGVVSNTGVNFVHSQSGNIQVYRDMIQTDAAISSGNSGGPLVDTHGELLGMNTLIYSTSNSGSNSGSGAGSIGIGFSIPVSRINSIIEKLKLGKELRRDYYTGLEVRELDERLSQRLGIRQQDGVIVYGINKRSPSDIAGLEPGDLITQIDGKKIIDEEDFLLEINDHFVGDRLEFLILRGDKTLKKKMILIPPPKRR